jgi:serine/threonine-protein kinase
MTCPTCQIPHRTPRCPRTRVGELAGSLRLGAWIADGPQATVFAAERDGERAAVKVYDVAPDDAALAARVDRERTTQHKVTHACVARLLEAGRLDDGAPFLASTWIDGELLEVRLQQRPLGWSELIPIVAAIGRGLGAIHAAGVVHRDLKPTNVMLAREPAAVVLDFGHALALGADRLTQDDQVLGSASYMAPEQAAGATVDPRADLYSLGVIVYRALTGVLPFVDASAAEVLRLHVTEPVVPPRQRAPERDIPAAAEDLCMWLLAKDPAVRLPSARVLAFTLAALSSRDDARVGASP